MPKIVAENARNRHEMSDVDITDDEPEPQEGVLWSYGDKSDYGRLFKPNAF